MSNRRNFIKKMGAATASIAVTPMQTGKIFDHVSFKKSDKPVVISTWDFGLKANEAAWAVLEKGGAALDAVEAGVKIPEGDPEERSVGYGGRPDRDGKVTLDACI